MRDGYNDDIAITPDGKTIVFTRMSISFPTQIYKAGSERSIADQLAHPPAGLSHINDAAALRGRHVAARILLVHRRERRQGPRLPGQAAELRRLEEISREVPHPRRAARGLGRRLELSLESRTVRVTNFIATPSGYVVLMINFHGSTGYGQKFIDAINGDWGGAPYEDLMKGLDYAEKTYPFIDKNRECALGASYGGYAINWILGHTDRFKCLVSHDGMFNAESAWGTTEELWFNNWEFKGTPYDNRARYQKWSPHQYAKNFKTPTLVVHGQRDYRLDVSEGFQLFTTLQMEGVPSKMLYFPDEGHWVHEAAEFAALVQDSERLGRSSGRSEVKEGSRTCEVVRRTKRLAWHMWGQPPSAVRRAQLGQQRLQPSGANQPLSCCVCV